MIFPRHLTLTLSHNDHKSNYMSVALHCECLQVSAADWVSEGQQRKAYETGEIWDLQWYPDTPVGFCRKLAADIDVLMEWAERYAMDEKTGSLSSQ
jgi:hypothetical protein